MTAPLVPDSLRDSLRGRYAVERELGRGAMAQVYLADDLSHTRRVALKVLHPEVAAAVGPERFLREIRLTAGLRHPHIVPLFDSGEAGGRPWYVMPLVEGGSLRDRLKREKQLPLGEAIEIACDVLAALGHAHGRGIIHRDVKPENIMLDRGEAMLADFGIAQAIDAESQRLTATGLAIGTPAYMSPEQSAGERELDGRSDLYGLGCVLYEMLTGTPPFTGPTAQAVLARHALDPVPPLTTVRKTVPRSVEAVVLKALEKLPVDRFRTAADFAGALRDAAAATTRRPRSRWHRPVVAATGIAVVALSTILLRQRSAPVGRRDAPVASAVTRLAVLPFENLGDSADAYFADGVADAVRGKLAAIGGLEVIARASSVTYSHTTKRPEVIAAELGVQYLLTGTVRWARAKDGTSHVQVSPELVDVRQGRTPATRWQQPFDAALTDVFQIQADIADRVAEALDLALGVTEHRQLAQRPTVDLAAYTAFLKGEAAAQSLAAEDLPTLRLAVPFYQEAVARDSTFGLAWARLALAHAQIYGFGSWDPLDAEAAARALTKAKRLAPGTPETYRAQVVYEDWVRRDFETALTTAEAGLLRNRDQSDLIAMAAVDEFRLGRVAAAVTRLTRAQALDPRSFIVARNLGYALTCQRRWQEAHRALSLAQSLSPTDVSTALAQVRTYVAEGDLSGARRVLAEVPPGVDPMQRATVVAYEDLFWILDDATQRRVLTLPPSGLDGERSDWALMRAQVYRFRGDTGMARVYADSARIAFEARLVAAPNDEWLHILRGSALAYLGRKAEAIQEGRRGTELLPISRDALSGPDIQNQLVLIYLLVGEPEQALKSLEPLLKMPYYLSPAWVRIDPAYEPLRGNPRFERLLKGAT
jgi:eukaryotic-like serine/threonine-protein kinase